METELKGYALSNDHEKLWQLLQDGYNIPVVMYDSIPNRLIRTIGFAFGRMSGDGTAIIEGEYDYIRTDDKKIFLKECEERYLYFIPTIE